MEIIFDNLYDFEFFENGGTVTLKDSTNISLDNYKDYFDDPKDLEILTAKIGNKEYVFDKQKEIFKYVPIYEKITKRDPYGIPNINFTCIDEKDSMWEKMKEQRIERGFDDTELWNLDNTIIRFIYPRIKEFYEMDKAGYPAGLDPKTWETILEKIVKAFKYMFDDDTIKHQDEIQKGLDLFNKYFYDLWD